MAPHSSTLAWKIPWMEEPGRLQSMVYMAQLIITKRCLKLECYNIYIYKVKPIFVCKIFPII